ncbi:zinc-binding dehydrogenase [soil metagenome]
MKALQFSDSIPRYALSKAVSKARSDVFWGRLACLQMREVDPPPLPNSEWLRVRTRFGGICGSDLGTITLHASTSTSVFTSFPFTLGHENVGVAGDLGDQVAGVMPRQRVVVNPLLPCSTRGFDDPCDMCARGDVQLCQRFNQGTIAPGLLTGFCRDTGGSWSKEFVAHQSQVLIVPDNVSDEQAVLAEPFAVAIHPVIRDVPGDDDTAVIIGGGVIGLCTIAAIRGLGSRARIIIVARHEFQAQMARELGADVVVGRLKGSALEKRMVDELGANSLKPILGKNVIVGGAQYVYDCVGSPSSVDDALRYAGSGGSVVLIGLAGVPAGVDWTPIWLNELTVRGTFCYGIEEYQGERLPAMAVALRLMAEGKVDLEPLLTHRFRLDDYQEALATVTGKSSSGVIKAVFAFEDE